MVIDLRMLTSENNACILEKLHYDGILCQIFMGVSAALQRVAVPLDVS